MTHIVEIADAKGATMQLSVSVETFGWSGSWRAIDKGMIRHNSGPVNQAKDEGVFASIDAELMAGGAAGIRLYKFIGSVGVVNDEGTGVLERPWGIALDNGPIEWSLV
jgi:hypothetical protein